MDTNIFMYAVGRPHPLQHEARALLIDHVEDRRPLATSAEVLQELMHAYLPVRRLRTLDAALRLATDLATIWPIEGRDVADARHLVRRHPGLGARDLLHLAVCVRRGVVDLLTFDRQLAAAFAG
ncbi:MAG: type II toxin-antitoxin system VapC family toxin [Actinomycetota bacterium]|nr:type II toxin-antitoxin system VapC family toxin [Actinomycetota bacterium]